MKEHHQKPEANTSPVLRRHPLDHRQVTKIALGRNASETLHAIGKYHFILASPADCTAPAWARDRMVLLSLPLDKETADAAASVALGTHRAAKIK